MKGVVKRFAHLTWTEIAPGAKEKRLIDGDHIFRLVQFSPPFQEVEHCLRAHVGYVVRGDLEIEFANSNVQCHEGDALCIPAGIEFAHRAIVNTEVTLFLIESA